MDFVQILNDNKEETLFYYHNNWKVLREKALENNYIHAYELLETEATEDAPFQLILKTTYLNKEQFDQSEENFQKLIDEKGETRFLNEKRPPQFRKLLFHKNLKHLE
ncbi:hypothetical protein GTQ38_09575 [Flavobacteriaceae bacterium R33]|uniref:Uncharacterized protein n=1 Tax=Poritiphilus flavus TaxID=2697053 RepID=A0A6L9EBZ9_9FLAO|nr:hypothetical protein [Poritiphilus flavus]